MKNDKPKSIKEILEKYDPIVEFKRKHKGESREEFNDWLNK